MNKFYNYKIFFNKILVTILLFFISSTTNATKFTLQEHKVTINMKDSYIVDILKEIQKQTGLNFAYNNKELSLNKKSIYVSNKSVNLVLNELMEGTDFIYKIVDGNINIIRKAEVRPKTTQIKQPKTIKIDGKVTDKNDKPIVGATVLIKGTTIGAITDSKGKFTINAEAGNKIEISCMGCVTLVKDITSQSAILNIVLERSNVEVDDVIVTAYGSTTKKLQTGSTTTIKSKDIKDIPSVSIASLLQGRVAGMDVTQMSGAPGGGGTAVTLRGFNSLSADVGRRYSNPLWVVDGVPMATFTSSVTGINGLSDLNPETIESVEILKDASATALYGSRAANGVILVTTKKGNKNQRAQFDANVSYSYNFIPSFPTQYGGAGERDYNMNVKKGKRTAYFDKELGQYVYPTSASDAYENGGIYDWYWWSGKEQRPQDSHQDSLNSYYNNSTNHFAHNFEAAKTTNVNLQTSGGSENMTYSLGLGYYDEDGIEKGSGYSRINVMGNFNIKPAKAIDLTFNIYMTYSDKSVGKHTEQGEIEIIQTDPFRTSSLISLTEGEVELALQAKKNQIALLENYRLRSSFMLKIDLYKGLGFSNTISLDYGQDNSSGFTPGEFDEYNHSSSKGNQSKNYTILNEALLTYRGTIAKNHSIDLLAGASYENNVMASLSGYAKGGPSDLIHHSTPDRPWHTTPWEKAPGVWVNLSDYNSNFEEKKMISFFGRFNYNYKEKYIFSATIREDGSSVFGRNNRWATFPSFAVAWNFSEEGFLSNFRPLDLGKLRASWGMSGNQFTQPYLAYGILESGSTYLGQSSIRPITADGYYNPDLGWEETKQFDIGFDLAFFNHRLSITADYYNRVTDKLLSTVPLPNGVSYYDAMWVNSGALANEGVEFEFKYDIFRKKDFVWNISINLSKNWNMMLETYNGKDLNHNGVPYVIGKEIGAIKGFRSDGYIETSDQIKYKFYADGSYRSLSPKNQLNQPYTYGDINMIDVNGDGYIDKDGDEVYLGSSLPKLFGGIVNSGKWKSIDFNILWSFSLGRDIHNYNLQSAGSLIGPVFMNVAEEKFWEKPGDGKDATYPSYSSLYRSLSSGIIDKYVESVNYVKLKTVVIGWTMPEYWFRKSFIRTTRLFFSGENLLTFTNYSGLDPETVDLVTGIDKGLSYPLARKFTFGLTVQF